jgi:ribosome maturation factor RimP
LYLSERHKPSLFFVPIYYEFFLMTLQESLLELIESVIDGEELFLVDTEFKGNSQNEIISVYVDTKVGGVNIDDCAKISREIAFLIDTKELIVGKYTLNVSSPGLDRPLKDARQFPKNVGRKTSVKFKYGDETKTLKGNLSAYQDEKLTIDLGNGKTTEIMKGDLLEVKILPAF